MPQAKRTLSVNIEDASFRTKRGPGFLSLEIHDVCGSGREATVYLDPDAIRDLLALLSALLEA